MVVIYCSDEPLAAAGASHNDVWMLYAEPWRREVKALLDQVPWRFAEKQLFEGCWNRFKQFPQDRYYILLYDTI